ncbi:hypothetical protein ACLKA6_010511 [Drosophila palustris]
MQRLDFCRSNMTWTKEWERVVFSEEKKFNLEGPDGYAYYFHDIRKEVHTLDRLHSRAGGVMVWGAITYFGTIELQFLTSRMNATKVYWKRLFLQSKIFLDPWNGIPAG